MTGGTETVMSSLLQQHCGTTDPVAATFPQDVWRHSIRNMRPGCYGRMLTYAPQFLDKQSSVHAVTSGRTR